MGTLFVAGLSHRTAPVEVREQLAARGRQGARDPRRPRGRGRARRGDDPLHVQPRRGLRRRRGAGRGAARGLPAPRRPARAWTSATIEPLALHEDRRRGRAPRVPGRGEPRLDDPRRAPDPRPGEGRLRPRPVGGHGGARAPRADEPGLRRGQEGAHGDRGRPPRGVGLLRRGGARAEDLREPRRQGRCCWWGRAR